MGGTGLLNVRWNCIPRAVTCVATSHGKSTQARAPNRPAAPPGDTAVPLTAKTGDNG